LLTKLAFVDIGVEGEVVLVSKERGYFAHRESQLEEILDALQICVKLAFLNGAFWFSQRDALLLFSSEGFFGSQANEIAFQFCKKRVEADPRKAKRS